MKFIIMDNLRFAGFILKYQWGRFLCRVVRFHKMEHTGWQAIPGMSMFNKQPVWHCSRLGCFRREVGW